LLRGLLGWGLRHGFREDAARTLDHSWRDTSMTDHDVRLWAERLGPPAPPAGGETEREADPGEGLEGAGPGPGGRPGGPDPGIRRQPLALMLDWENVKIGLARYLDELPDATALSLRTRLAGAELAPRLLDAAWRHGLPRQRWAVAEWDR